MNEWTAAILITTSVVSGAWLSVALRSLLAFEITTPDGELTDCEVSLSEVNASNQEIHTQPKNALPAPYICRWWVHGIVLLFLNAAGWWLIQQPSFAAHQLWQFAGFICALYALAWVDALTWQVPALPIVSGFLVRLSGVYLGAEETAMWELLQVLQGALVGAGGLYLVNFFYQSLRGKQCLGEGDAAVLALAGAFVGVGGLLPVLLVASISGLCYGLLRTTQSRQFSERWSQPIPFVPFLSVAAALVYLLQQSGMLENLSLLR